MAAVPTKAALGYRPITRVKAEDVLEHAVLLGFLEKRGGKIKLTSKGRKLIWFSTKVGNWLFKAK